MQPKFISITHLYLLGKCSEVSLVNVTVWQKYWYVPFSLKRMRASLARRTLPPIALAARSRIASAPLLGLVGSPDKHELRLDAGHIGLVVGRTAARTTIPTIIEFVKQRSEVAACASSRSTSSAESTTC